MANKTEIKKFLERKAVECENKLKSEKEEKVKESIQKFMLENKVELKKINFTITDFDEILGKMIFNIETDKTACINRDYYESPIVISNKLHSCFTSSNIGEKFKITECEKIKDKYKQIIKDSKSEYARLLAVTQTMDAKDGIELLERLGFDIAEIVVKKEVTALSTNIDVNKLFVN